jgi:hypothetical protein
MAFQIFQVILCLHCTENVHAESESDFSNRIPCERGCEAAEALIQPTPPRCRYSWNGRGSRRYARPFKEEFYANCRRSQTGHCVCGFIWLFDPSSSLAVEVVFSFHLGVSRALMKEQYVTLCLLNQSYLNFVKEHGKFQYHDHHYLSLIC